MTGDETIVPHKGKRAGKLRQFVPRKPHGTLRSFVLRYAAVNAFSACKEMGLIPEQTSMWRFQMELLKECVSHSSETKSVHCPKKECVLIAKRERHCSSVLPAASLCMCGTALLSTM